MTTNVDMGGNTLIVEAIRAGATAPGQEGTLLSGSELVLLDGVSATSGVVASKAVVANAAGGVPVTRTIKLGTAYASPTALTAADSGSLCVFDEAAGNVFNLPAASAGLWFDFVLTASVTSNLQSINAATGDFFIGTVEMVDTDSSFATSVQTANGSTHLSIDMNGTTTGGLVGTWIRVVAISDTLWHVSGRIQHSGNVGSPFATS